LLDFSSHTRYDPTTRQHTTMIQQQKEHIDVLDTPMSIGAKYEFTDNNNETLEITQMSVDEDLVVHVTVKITGKFIDEKEQSLYLNDVLEKIDNNELTRSNSGHEAWLNRQNRQQ